MAVSQGNGLNRGVADATYTAADSDEIRRDIDQTRCEMDRTIDELGERLRPRNLFDEVVASVRGSLFSGTGASCPPGTTGGMTSAQMSQQVSHLASGVGRSLVDAVRENPVPAALMGAGLAWLLFEDKAERAYRRRRIESHVRGYTGDRYTDPHTHSGSFVDARTGEPYDENYGHEVQNLLACDYCATAEWSHEEESEQPGKVQRVLDDIQANLARGGTSAKESLQGVAAKIGEFVGGTRETATGFGHHIADASRRFGRQVGRRASHLGRQAGHQASDTWGRARDGGARMGRQIGARVKDGAATGRDAFVRGVEEAPLAVGAAFLGLGLIAGLALPRSRMEDELMGEAADDLRDRARRTGEEIVERGQHVAQATIAAAADEAERQGLTAEQLARKAAESIKKVEQVAERAADEASRETQREVSHA